jgi:hypothetical protein
MCKDVNIVLMGEVTERVESPLLLTTELRQFKPHINKASEDTLATTEITKRVDLNSQSL